MMSDKKSTALAEVVLRPQEIGIVHILVMHGKIKPALSFSILKSVGLANVPWFFYFLKRISKLLITYNLFLKWC